MRARVGFSVGLIVILAALVWAATVLLHTEQDVLFANLSAQDASAMTAELDRMKVPYRLGDDGVSILVDKSIVHQTRLKLMSKDLPLHGAVGFELFNNNDFGMTEFAQKVNYQRALQGEITRTILSLDEIESARVHIVFADEGLFKRDQQRAKASVTLGVKHNHVLKADQVLGIQRLVSAAVAGIAPADVTVLNQQGVALSRDSIEEEAGNTGAQLEIQQDVERYLNKKVSEVLSKAYGQDRFVSSVNVSLDMNQVRVTSEDVVGANAKGEPPAGIVVRERESIKDAVSAAGTSSRDAAGTAPSSSIRDTEYQVGRRVEQVVKRPGSIARLQVLAVIKQRMDAAQIEHLRSLVSAAVGASADRGDSVIVQSVEMLGGDGSNAAAAPAPGTAATTEPALEHRPLEAAAPTRGVAIENTRTITVLVLLFLAGLSALTLYLFGGRRKATHQTSPAALSAAEREQALARVRAWMSEPDGVKVQA
jgi:flagellar M-ring protein FliF